MTDGSPSLRQPLVHALALLAAWCIGGPAIGASAAVGGMAGQWQYDAAASDDFAARLAAGIAEQRRRWRAPRMRGAGDPENVGALPELLPPEADDRVQARFAELLQPPKLLRLAFDAGDIELTADEDPTRRYTPGRAITRMDSSGTAAVMGQWSNAILTIRARYTHRVTLLHQYTYDRRQDLLRVRMQFNDPATGKLDIQSVYRRKAQGL